MGTGRLGVLGVGGGALLLAMMGDAPAALAQAPAPASAAPAATGESESVRALLAEGARLAAAKDLKGALTAYKHADTMSHTPPVALEVARTHEALGSLLEAHEAYRDVARIPVEPNEPAAWATARAEAASQATKIGERLPGITITVRGLPPGAQAIITIDGAESSGAPGSPRKVGPGKHTVAVRASGFLPSSVDVELREGENSAVEVPLTQDPAAAGAAAPTTTQPLLLDASTAVDREATDRSTTFIRIGVGVTTTGVLVGTAFGLLSLSRASDAKQYCDANDHCTPEARSDIDSSKTLANIANVSFGVGLVGVGLLVYGLVIRPSSRSAAATGLVVRPVAGGLGGTF